jgi:3-methyladenine DNA glycosylase AlkD
VGTRSVSVGRRVSGLRRRLRAAGKPEVAAYEKAYHKSPLRFHGVRAKPWTEIVREVFPTRERLPVEDTRRIAAALWALPWMEERAASIHLLGRVAEDLGVRDLPTLRRMTRECHGWGLLDSLAVAVLGPLALAKGDPVYRRVRTWSKDPDLWTRRASVLVHVLPARRGRLEDRFAWPTFEELLPDRDFFLRKAIGWTLRECCRHYPDEVHAFLRRVGVRASGLTRREGSRRLPPALRASLTGA